MQIESALSQCDCPIGETMVSDRAPASVAIEIDRPLPPGFGRSEYHAAAGERLVIYFRNSLQESDTRLTLLISSIEDPVISRVPAVPGMGVTVLSKAIYVGDPARPREMKVLNVPPLKGGIYQLQVRERPRMSARLILE